VPVGHALLDFLWQGAAVAACAWLMLFALRHARPQWRYAVACLALSICLALPLLSVWRFGMAADGIAAFGGDAAAPLLRSASDSPAPPTADGGAWWSALIGADHGADRGAHLGAKFEAMFAAFERTLPGWVLAWALGVMLMLGRTLAGLVWVHRLRMAAVAPLDPALIACGEALRLRIGVARTVRLCASADEAIARLGPIAIGVVAPVVMLPAALVARMPSDLLQALIAHELAHIRRHDYLVNLVQTLAEALLFYHPAVWWLSRRIRHERELVADDLAARALGDPRTLAKALAELDRLHAETAATPLLSHLPHTLSQAARGGPLMSRIRSLTQPARPAPGIALPLVAAGAIAAACLAYAQTDPPNLALAPAAVGVSKAEPTPNAMPKPLPAPSTAALALASQADTGVTGMTLGQSPGPDEGRDRSFALVRAGQEGFAISGALEDVERIRAAKARIDGDFVWFQRDGKAYVVRDPATVARIGTAWRASEANEAKMQALSAQMERKSAEAQALAQQLSAKAAERAFEQAKAHERMAYRAEIAATEQLAAQLADTARQQAALELQHAQHTRSNDREREAAAAALDAQQAALERRMQALETEIEAKSAKLEADVERDMSAMERDLEARLEAANGPLEAIGAEMEALAKEQDKIMARIEREVGEEIDRALRESLVEPAP
jgi:beta-lactamase regulating signal transducer with metallopeptidase domain